MKSRAALITSIVFTSLCLNLSVAMGASSESLLQQGINANKDYKSEEAIKLLDGALQQNPNLTDAYIERGKAKSNLQKHKEAIEDYDRALQHNPNSVEAYINRGKAKQISKQYEAAMKDFDRAIELDPKSLSAYYWRGILYRVYLKQKERGDKDFDRALNLTPESLEDYGDLRFIFDLRKAPKAGIEYFTKAINLNYKNKQYAYLARGVLYERIDKPRFDLAIVDRQKMIESEHELTAGYKSAAIERISFDYLQLENYAEAIANANEALKLDPKNYDSLVDRGQAFYYLKDYSAALADFNAAIAINPNYSWFYAWRGDTYYNLNNYEQAIAEYDRAIAISPSSAYLYQRRGNVEAWIDRSDAAIADYQKSLKLAQKDGNLKMVKSLTNSIEDIRTKPQRMIFGSIIALLLTGTGYAGLVAISRRNEAKYLQQFKN
jgi:tetratricopeptide (TPR) repeat protein